MANIKRESFRCLRVALWSVMVLMVNLNAYGMAKAGFQQALCKPYIRSDLGYSWTDKKIFSGHTKKPRGAFVGSIGAGYAIHKRFKTDVTASYRGLYKYSESTVRQDFHSLALMLNGYFSPIAFDKVIPYVMAGGGISINRAGHLKSVLGNGRVLGDCTEELGWQIGVGSFIRLGKRTNLDIMYKYVDLGKAKLTGVVQSTSNCCNGVGSRGRLRVQEISLGINYFF